MTDEILINVTAAETRVALLSGGTLREILIERHARRSIAGNIYLGKVARVLPGMQAAFIDIGVQRTAFLHARDLDADPQTGERGGQLNADTGPSITSRIHSGEQLMLQALKDPIGGKGARLTAAISIPSRHLVYLPNSDYVGVSRRIEAPAVREKLAAVLREAYEQVAGAQGGGFILRTAAQDATAEEIRADMAYLLDNWKRTLQRRQDASAPALLYRDLPPAVRAVRDFAHRETERVRIDCAETHRQVADFTAALMPTLLARIEHYRGERPIFALHSVEDDLHKALQKSVPLPSGGHLIIDQTAAMTTVDVNTGSFVGAHDLPETFLKTNLEASAALARQLRLRNIGGLVVVDFIDMASAEHRAQVMRALEQELAQDHGRAQVNEMSSLGLVEITRKRTRESLERLLTEPCPACQGRGIRQTAESIGCEIVREVRDGGAEKYRVVASQAVVDLLREDESAGLAGVRKMIDLQVEPNYRQEQFDVVAL